MPGLFLRDGGIADGEIILEFDKYVRKSKSDYKHEHPFTAEDIQDLPISINSPIAIFKSTNQRDNVILAELQKAGRNFIVVIRATKSYRKGGVILR